MMGFLPASRYRSVSKLCIWCDLSSLSHPKRLESVIRADCVSQTGAGTTASRLGMADLGVASRTDMKEHADMIANLDPGKITIADMDTGYGGRRLVFPGYIRCSSPLICAL